MSPTNNQPYATTQISVPWFFPSDYIPSFDKDTFAVISTQPSKMQGEHWITTANSCRIFYSAESIDR